MFDNKVDTRWQSPTHDKKGHHILIEFEKEIIVKKIELIQFDRCVYNNVCVMTEEMMYVLDYML